jgi:hypothetical protein
MKVRNDNSNSNKVGGKNMKKIMIILVMVITVILTGVLYGTHSLIIEEKATISLEQTYMAQYPAQMPDVIIHPMVNLPL